MLVRADQGKMSSLAYLEFIERLLAYETVEQIIVVCLMNLRTLFKNYLPLDIVHQKKDEMFNILLDMLKKAEVTKEPIVD